MYTVRSLSSIVDMRKLPEQAMPAGTDKVDAHRIIARDDVAVVVAGAIKRLSRDASRQRP